MVAGRHKLSNNMKRILSIAMLFMLSLVLCAQEKDVTKFLGIPVDGSKAEMIRKLTAKGFRRNPETGLLSGEFNGRNVSLSVVTNNDKVWRIVVFDDARVDERSVQIRFNGLCRQFENNSKYIPASDEQTISDDEEIGYEISVHKKRYEAAFYQKSTEGYGGLYERLVWFMISESYGKYYIIMYYDNKYNEANGEDL